MEGDVETDASVVDGVDSIVDVDVADRVEEVDEVESEADDDEMLKKTLQSSGLVEPVL